MFQVNRVSLDVFLPKIKIFLHNKEDFSLPDVALISFVRDTLQEFCKKTHAVRRNYSFDGQSGVNQYLLPVHDCETPIFGLALNLAPAEEQGVGLLGTEGFGVGVGTIHSAISYERSSWSLRDGVVHVAAAGDCYNYNFDCVVMPSHTACEVDAQIFEEWGDVIVDGALARILRIPAVPGSSVQLSEYYEKRFDTRVGEVAMRLLAGSSSQGVRLAPNRSRL